MPHKKFIKIILYMTLLFAIPFFLMVYSLRCERLRLSGQKRAIERMIEKQRKDRYDAEVMCHAFDEEDEEN